MWLDVVYCDDVRHESGGKFSYIGTYTGSMEFGSFPAALPKFCVAAILGFEAKTAFPSEVKYSIRLNGAEVGGGTLEPEAMQTAAINPEEVFAIQCIMTSAPFMIAAPSRMEVVAFVDGEEIRGRPLLIKLRPAATTNESSPSKQTVGAQGA